MTMTVSPSRYVLPPLVHIRHLKKMIFSRNVQDSPKFRMDLYQVEVPTSINGLDLSYLNYIMPSIKGLKILLSSDDKLKWEQSPHGSSFEY